MRHRKVLKVNLSTGKIAQEKIQGKVLKKYLGPRGIGGRTLVKEVPKNADPLGPENVIIIATGPLTGLAIGGTRSYAISKSPLTGGYGAGNAGGGLGRELRKAGFDELVISGKAPEPTYLSISPGDVQLKSAESLWGKSTGETTDEVREKNNHASVAAIGPSGEMTSPLAAIILDKHRAYGRTGTGAVMGSKNLKAIAVKGNKKIEAGDPDRLRDLNRELAKSLKEDPGKQATGKYGTAFGVSPLNEMGILPTKNFQMGSFKDSEKISGETLYDTILEERLGCPGCTLRCIRSVKVTSGPFAPINPEYGGPEYETIAAFGSNCLISDLSAIAKAHELCNAYGMDTMSAGDTVAWAMECYEKGILSKNDLDGIKLEWGNARAMVELVGKMVKREGVGHLLSRGVKRASENIGQGSEEFAMHVKGLEMALQEPRGKIGQGLGYAIGPRGAAHTEVVADTLFESENSFPEVGITEPISRFEKDKEKGSLVVKAQDIRILTDLSGGCGLVFYPWSNVVNLTVLKDFINACTGEDYSISDLMTISERATTVARVFNVREGFKAEDDDLPSRLAEPLADAKSGETVLTAEDVEDLRNTYYECRNWDDNGIPKPEKLESLGLSCLNSHLEEENWELTS